MLSQHWPGQITFLGHLMYAKQYAISFFFLVDSMPVLDTVLDTKEHDWDRS